MKQVVFAIALLAMASLTGCLNEDDDSSDTTYKPSKNSSINIPYNMTVVKTGNRITTDCYTTSWWEDREGVMFMDVNSNLIWNLDPDRWFISNIYVNGERQWNSTILEYGWEACEDDGGEKLRININLPQEPVRFGIIDNNGDTTIGTF